MVLLCCGQSGLDINVLLCQDRAPDVEEPVVNSLEKEPAELTKGDKDEKRPDVVDVEHETGQEDDGEVFYNKDTVNDQLAIEAPLPVPDLLLFLFLGGQRQNQVVHVQVADAV